LSSLHENKATTCQPKNALRQTLTVDVFLRYQSPQLEEAITAAADQSWGL
jgi:hypothetical protein